jgi:hypothetical protein
MSYKIQLSPAQIHAICAALEQTPPQPNPAHDEHTRQEVDMLLHMFQVTLKEPESAHMLHGFTL